MTTTNDRQVPDVAARNDGDYVFALDGVRGLAAFAVVLYHVEYFHQWFSRAYLAVDLFFVLSGYVLSHRYSASASATTGFAKFSWARIARLYPLHLFTLLLLAVAEVILSHVAHKHAVIPEALEYTFVLNLLLLQCVGLWTRPSWNTSSWSISVELWVNLFWYWMLGQIRSFKLLIGLLFTVWLLGTASLFFHSNSLDYHPESIGFVNAGVLRCVTGFSCGALIFYFRDQLRRFSAPAAFIATLLFVVVCLYSIEAVDYVVALSLFPLLVISALGRRGWLVSILEWRPVAWLGLISYSIYLNHLLVIKAVNLVAARLDLLARGLLIVALTLALSWLTYRYIECPARSFLLSRWRTKNAGVFGAA